MAGIAATVAEDWRRSFSRKCLSYSALGLFYKSLQRNDFAAVDEKLSTCDADIR